MKICVLIVLKISPNPFKKHITFS